MAPKAATATEPHPDVLILIHLIRTATDFKADMVEMAKICKISDKKNVPRKINSVLTLHGYKWVSGKIEQDAAVKDMDSHEDSDMAVLKTPAKLTKKVAKTPKSKEPKGPKTPKSNKKRKIEEEEKEPEDSDADVNKGAEDDTVDSNMGGEEDDGLDTALKEEGSEEE